MLRATLEIRNEHVNDVLFAPSHLSRASVALGLLVLRTGVPTLITV